MGGTLSPTGNLPRQSPGWAGPCTTGPKGLASTGAGQAGGFASRARPGCPEALSSCDKTPPEPGVDGGREEVAPSAADAPLRLGDASSPPRVVT